MPDYYSRFVDTPTVTFDGQVVPDVWVPPAFLQNGPLPAGSYTTITATWDLEGRPDKISQLYYGTPLLDWVLIAYNHPDDTLNWPRAGDLVQIPLATIVLPGVV